MFSLHFSTNLSASLFLDLQILNLNFLQHDMIHHIHINNYVESKKILYHTTLCLSILCIHIYIYLHLCLLLQTFASSLHLHLQVSCHFMCLVSLALEIRLNILASMFQQHQEHIISHMDH